MWDNNNNQDDLFGELDPASAPTSPSALFKKSIKLAAKRDNAVKKVNAIASNYNKHAITESLAPCDDPNHASYAINAMTAYGYMPTLLIGCMPHKETQGTHYETTNGRDRLIIQSLPHVGVPYGKYPRLIMPFLAKHAKMQIDHSQAQKDPDYRLEITLGKNFDEFLRALNVKGAGGETTRRHRVSEQFQRLLACRFAIQTQRLSVDSGTGAFKQMLIAKEGSYDFIKNENGILVPDWRDGKIVLSREFYSEAMSHSLPVRLPVLFQLETSLQMDVYTWLEYRLNTINSRLYLSWANIKPQFGKEYANTPQGMAHFKSRFKEALNKVIIACTTNIHKPVIHMTNTQIIIEPLKKHLSSVDSHDLLSNV